MKAVSSLYFTMAETQVANIVNEILVSNNTGLLLLIYIFIKYVFLYFHSHIIN